MNPIPKFVPYELNIMNDRRIKRLNNELPNLQGLGAFFALNFILANEPNQRCNLDDIDLIAYDLRTSSQILMTVIESYNLFQIFADENGKKFFCPMLDKALLPYFDKCEKNRENALLGAKKRSLKLEEQKLELKKKEEELKLLSHSDSTKRPLNKRSASITEQKRKKEKRKKENIEELIASDIQSLKKLDNEYKHEELSKIKIDSLKLHELTVDYIYNNSLSQVVSLADLNSQYLLQEILKGR
jgi:hypothetical protein